MKLIRRFLGETRATTAVEYGLILAVLSLVIVGGVGQAFNAIEEMFSNNDSKFQQAFD